MFEEIKIFIPTKGRINNQKTYNILKELNLNPILVIEPQEETEAFKKGYNFIVLPYNNKGISFSRNYILDYSRKNNLKYICMLDDDIKTFGYIIKDDNHTTNCLNQKREYTNEAFLDALKYFLKNKNCGTLQSTQFAWCQLKDIVYNKCIQCVYFLYIPQINGINFDENIIEDKDFSLQLLLNKNITTFRLNKIFFSTDVIGTTKGGIEDRFNKQKIWSENMQKKWGKEIVKIIEEKNSKKGMINIRLNWPYINKIIKKRNLPIQHKLPIQTSFLNEQLQFPFMKDYV